MRGRAEGLQDEFTKPNTRKHRVNPGASASVCAGIIDGRVRLWHYLPQGRWNGEVAAKTYQGPIYRALKTYRGEKDEYVVLEDSGKHKANKARKETESATAAKTKPCQFGAGPSVRTP